MLITEAAVNAHTTKVDKLKKKKVWKVMQILHVCEQKKKHSATTMENILLGLYFLYWGVIEIALNIAYHIWLSIFQQSSIKMLPSPCLIFLFSDMSSAHTLA